MKSKRPFAPPIVRKLDEYLLLHHPSVWSARSHWVLYYGGLFLLFLLGISWLVPNDARNDSNMGVWSTLISIVSLIGIVFWVIYLLRFNVFKRFGIQHKGAAIITFLLYFIATGVFVVAPFIPSYIETQRALKAYEKKEIYNDVNNINAALCRLEYDSIPHSWKSYTFRYVTSGDIVAPKYNTDEYRSDQTIVLDSTELAFRIKKADSLVMLPDGRITIFESPVYNFLTPYQIMDEDNDEVWKSAKLYRQVIERFKRSDTIGVKEQLDRLMEKYTSKNKDRDYYDRYNSMEIPDSYEMRINRKYPLRESGNSINNIIGKQERWENYGWEIFLRVFYYMTISITLLLFIFRHSTPKTFFLSILTGVILGILTILFMATITYFSVGKYPLLVGYYILFLAFAAGIFFTKTKKIVTGIGLNLLVFFTLYLPLIIVSWYFYNVERKNPMPDAGFYAEQQKYLLYAEIAGALLLLLLIEPVFKKCYRRWWAQPEN